MKQKRKKYFNKIEKVIKQTRDFKGYGSFHHAGILNFFNLQLQLKGIESTIKNKLTDLLSELKGFKFMTTLDTKWW